MSGYNETLKRESSDEELTDALKAYGEGPSTVKEEAIATFSKAMIRAEFCEIIEAKDATIQAKEATIQEREATIELLRKENAKHKAEIESMQQNLTNANEYRTEKDGRMEELKRTQKGANRLQKHRFSQVQDHQIVQEFKAPPLPTVDVDPVPVKTKEVKLDLKDIMAKRYTPFERIVAYLQEFMRKYGAGMSLPSLLELKYPRVLNVMLDFLLCFAFTKRDVILSVKSSQYEKYLNNFHLDLCCMFCQEKQYHIERKNGNFYFKFAADDDRHICSISNLKQALLAQSQAKEDIISMFPKNMEVLGDDIDGIRTTALFMSVTVRVEKLFCAMLSMLIIIDKSSDTPRERRTASDHDLKMDCISAFNEGIKVKDMHRKVFSMNEKFGAAGGIVLPEYKIFELEWFKRCYETVNSAPCSNILSWQNTDKTSIPPTVTAVANFLLNKTNGSFLVGAFQTDQQLRFLFGNIDPRYSNGLRADTRDYSKATNSDRKKSHSSTVDVEDDGTVNDFVNSGDFQGWN